MVKKLKYQPQYSQRVTKISPTNDSRPISVTYANTTLNSSPRTAQYDYVISTMTFPNLRFVDIDKCNLSYAQRDTMRYASYAPVVKVGLKFRSRWWEEICGIKGGQSLTDRLVRTVVYPSYGIDDPSADAVLLASYAWRQDAQRLGSLMNGHNTADEKLLIDLVLNDLTALHGFDSSDFLREQLVDYLAWDWYSNPFSSGARSFISPAIIGWDD